MFEKRYILVGAKRPTTVTEDVFGGVLTLSDALCEYAASNGMSVDFVDTLVTPFSNMHSLQKIKRGILRWLQLISLLRKWQYRGVIIFSSAGLGFYERIVQALLCKILRVPCILFIVDGKFLSKRPRSRLGRWWVGFLLNMPTGIVASGKNWATLFSELGVKDDRVFRIHYWLSKSYPIRSGPQVLQANIPLRFVFVGWMIPEKGVIEILTALRFLFDRYSFTFTFLGAGPLLEYVKESIVNLRWESRVFAHGWVSNQQKQLELSSAHVFVLPSYSEGFPMSLIEAMSAGLPAICSDVGGISDSLHDGVNGLLIPPFNSQALRGAMEFYLENSDAISKHSTETLKIVRRNHDADENCTAIFNIFESHGLCAE
jgi:glycosyltransferase involved in cell wall biosynthesis